MSKHTTPSTSETKGTEAPHPTPPPSQGHKPATNKNEHTGRPLYIYREGGGSADPPSPVAHRANTRLPIRTLVRLTLRDRLTTTHPPTPQTLVRPHPPSYPSVT